MIQQSRDFPEDISKYMPHDKPMALLTKMLEVSSGHFIAETDIHEGSMFFKPDKGVPTYVSLEYMAQAISALDGYFAVQCGKKPRIGFLLGTRSMKFQRPYFIAGETLTIFVDETYNDGKMMAFNGAVEVEGDVVAKAVLNVFLPDDLNVFLKN